jgi:hypothetical protein
VWLVQVREHDGGVASYRRRGRNLLRKDRGGGAETLGEDELLYDDDPWTETQLVTTLFPRVLG